MNNKLIKTDTVWYKIKSFFRKFFRRNKINNTYELASTNKNEEESSFKALLKEETKECEQKNELASKLLTMEISCLDLTDTQVDSMIEYFTNDIKQIDNELLRIKQHILEMKKQLQ